MPLLDLSHVTSALVETLRLNITQRLDPALTTLAIKTLPPERVNEATTTINLYLYHIAEDAYYRNAPGNLSDANPAATKPMSLILYYILTTHHEAESDFDTVMQQRLMGYALKTFHDFARITDGSEIDGTPLLGDDMRGGDNALEIVLRPLSPEEATAFWSAEDRMTTRLSAYYEVRYALLEPDPPQRLPGIVLRLGNFIVDIASPQLAGTSSRVGFTLPAIAGGGTQTIEASPARVAPPGNRVTLLGTGLTIGRSRRIYLASARWRQRLPGVERVLVDPTLTANAADWAITETGGAIELTLGTQLTVAMASGPAIVLPVEPGIYSVVVEVVKDSRVVLGQLKEITDVSNPASFAVMPRIVSTAVVDAANRVIRVNLDPSADLTPPTGPGSAGPLDLLFVANGQNYLRHDPTDPAATFDPGDFRPLDDSLEFRASFDPAVAGAYPLRLIVEGAESQPFWMEVP